MFTVKRMADCTLTEAVQAWNEGFEGYYFNMTMTPDSFLKRLGTYGLSATHSVVAFDGDQPIGLVVNGIRTAKGIKLAYNGGTGVKMSYRNDGVGQLLMDEVLEIYQRENVQLATLEAIKENERAISLYRKKGYEIVDYVDHYQAMNFTPIIVADSPYTYMNAYKWEVTSLDFYNERAPWQTQCDHIPDAQYVLAKDERGEVVGYAVYRSAVDPDKKKLITTLMQCEVNEGNQQRTCYDGLLTQLFHPSKEMIRLAACIQQSNETLTEALADWGFERTVEQVYMVKTISS
ncbi:GNAT family N-acetyltransferase [Priestia koreensis]|uniref:GNAT family N-acetyltransferase n=1 Tax=Priestia koreensis TaxID=284581 RepID=UPI001F598518|nr:GNAT family N-acetyltransferase [Priestia koreensis]UNL86641.1 GNAT family N-acetyltransferase [Priestia koreensis]